ncbi:MAG: cell division FtsA domain-containing protein [Halanaerobiales bacterium]
MGFLDMFLKGQRKDYFKYRLILDIGTEFLKAVMVEYNNREKNILGFGRAKQNYGSMDGGAITNINSVIEKAKIAVEQACSSTPHYPQDMAAGIAGEFVKGVLISIDTQRKNPNKEINCKEIDDLVISGREQAYAKAVKMAEMETGIKDVKLELIQDAIVEVKVDGYRVNNPYQFKGNNINVIIFYTFAPLVQIGAIETIAGKLGYKLALTVAEPYAVASSILTNEAYEFGAIIIDIGGGTTDIALIRNGGIEGTRMFAMGGRAFTRSIAANLNIGLKKAEKLKLKYSQGQQIKDCDIINKLIKRDLNILYQGIELSLKDLAQGEMLPSNIYFCGGGSGLKGLVEGFKNLSLKKELPFKKHPNIAILKGNDMTEIADKNNYLTDVDHTTPKALSFYGACRGNNQKGLMDFESQRL